ncbi:MAG: hypothetical protein ACXAE3_02570 [Candidatus Kariarchaeaceae archaeon]|jgi:hypothetical protein
MANLARKGPRRVWTGYKTMRVPDEIFDDVRKYMERRKQMYLAEQEGLDPTDVELPHSPAYSLPGGTSKEEMSELIKEAIRQELQGGGRVGPNTVEIPPPTLTSQERVKQLLMNHPNQTFTTLQIGEMLDLPNSTAREATRTIASEVAEIRKISGRPNKFIYESTEA